MVDWASEVTTGARAFNAWRAAAFLALVRGIRVERSRKKAGRPNRQGRVRTVLSGQANEWPKDGELLIPSLHTPGNTLDPKLAGRLVPNLRGTNRKVLLRGIEKLLAMTPRFRDGPRPRERTATATDLATVSAKKPRYKT